MIEKWVATGLIFVAASGMLMKEVGGRQEFRTIKKISRQQEMMRDTISKNGLTLYFNNNSSWLTEDYKKRLVDTYFKQYPKLIKKYNKESRKEVTFAIDTAYKGVAATGGGVIRYNPTWFEKYPEDIDVVTHELMHVVQDYRGRSVPGWITEGIADYVRATEGINNAKAGWSLPAVKAGDSYTKSYRITARFFIWLTERYKKDLIKDLDKAARAKTYTDEFWAAQTGKGLDALWQEYSADPALK